MCACVQFLNKTQVKFVCGFVHRYGKCYISWTLTHCVISVGAALFYASTKEDKNVSLLHKYLLHRAYGLPFKEPACVVDKDSIFM